MSNVTSLATFKVNKLVEVIISTLQSEGIVSLKDHGEIPLQVGLAAEVMLDSKCPANVAMMVRGRTVARYIELVNTDFAKGNKTLAEAQAVPTKVAEAAAATGLDAELKPNYLVFPVTDDADELKTNVQEMLDALREKMGSTDGYSAQEMDALIGIHREEEDAIHVYIDADIYGDYAETIGESFEENEYEHMDAEHYASSYALMDILKSMEDETLKELETEVGTKVQRKWKKDVAIKALLATDADTLRAALAKVMGNALPDADAGDRTQIMESVVATLATAQLRKVYKQLGLSAPKTADHTGLLKGLQDRELVDVNDLIDALDALELMPEEEETDAPEEEESDGIAAVLAKLDLGQLKATAKALDIKVTSKMDEAAIIAELEDEDEAEVRDTLTDLGYLEDVTPADDESGEEGEEADAATAALQASLVEQSPRNIRALAKELDVELSKPKDVAQSVDEILADADIDDVKAACEELGIELDDAEEEEEPETAEEEEESESLEDLYALLESAKALRGQASAKKDALAEMAETDLTAAKRKDVVALKAIVDMVDVTDDMTELLQRLVSDESEVDEKVKGYIAAVFKDELADEEEEQEEEAPAKPAGKTGSGKKGVVTDKKSSRK